MVVLVTFEDSERVLCRFYNEVTGKYETTEVFQFELCNPYLADEEQKTLPREEKENWKKV